MRKANLKASKTKKTAKVKDLTARDARTVKGGATGPHAKKIQYDWQKGNG
jgi:hypothetical protein